MEKEFNSLIGLS